MAYTLDISLTLGAANTGIASNLRAQLVDTTGADTGAAVSTGFVEIGTSGNYLWHYASFPDGHRGGVKFYDSTASSTILAFVAINPEEAENTDAKTSTRLASASYSAAPSAATVADAVWDEATSGHATAGTFGAFLAALPSASAIATAVWASGTRTLSSFGTLIADIWANTTRTITGGTVTTVNDKTGYSLSTAGNNAIADHLLDTELSADHVTANTIGGRLSDIAGYGATTVTNTNSILARLGSFTGSGVNTVLGFLKALMSKAASTPSDVGGTFAASTDSTEALAEAVAAVATAVGGGGSGDILVNHDTGGTDNLRAVRPGGSPIDHCQIRAYLTSLYDAGTYTIAAEAITGTDGRWEAPMYLDAGTYTFVFSPSDGSRAGVVEQAVA